MPADRKRALEARAALAPQDTASQAALESTQPDAPSAQPDTAIPFAEAQFRQCSEARWSRRAWLEWLRWAKAVSALRSGDWFGSTQSIDPRYSVNWSGSDSLIGCVPGALLRDEAQTILQEFGVDVADFEQFWSTVHACVQLPSLTPAALKRDADVYGGALGLAARLDDCRILLRQRGLLR